ncbi:MAG: hypothetical protein M1828_004179 [Chrysothrix sp. TS-e1954]|nr:MAG: hypothetical protein M1828_004179 [Chrysothrix sp. TS-e1954]
MDQDPDRKALLAFDAIEEESQNTDYKTSSRPIRPWLDGFSGRGSQWGVAACASSAGVVLLINFITTVSLAGSKGFADGSSTIFRGDCSKAQTYSTVTHLFINIFSTVLLSSSNYCMQCLSAPTRQEVDEAHRRGKILDIGVPSVRNLFSISIWRSIFWAILCLSSVPLHVFYNSAIYSSTGVNDYVAISVNEAFLTLPSVNLTELGLGVFAEQFGNFTEVGKRMRSLYSAGELDRLEPRECIGAYAVDYISDRRNLLMVAPTSFDNSSESKIHGFIVNDNAQIDGQLSAGCDLDPYAWICGNSTCDQPCTSRNVTALQNNLEDWKPQFAPVDYCLSEKTPGKCELNLNLYLMIAVMIANLFKTVLMTALAFWLMDAPLLNLGDAISSFLSRADPMTNGACLFSRAQFRAGLDHDYGNHPDSAEWRSRRIFWHRTVGGLQWTVFFALYTLAVAVCIFLLVFGIAHLRGGDVSSIWDYGLGAAHTETLIYWQIPSVGAKGLIENVLVSNSPQIVLSFIYFTFNAILTRMLAGREWNEFAYIRKGLRVSTRALGSQRTTYFLQVPYRYGFPLLGLSALLHWLLSQSIFLVAVNRFNPLGDKLDLAGGGTWSYDSETQLDSGEFGWGADASNVCLRTDNICIDTPTHLTCSWSPVAVVCVIIVAAVCLTYCGVLAFRRYKPGMPLAGSSSAVIAAACHAWDEKTKIDIGAPVQWGVQRRPQGSVPGHCSFSAESVEMPEEGSYYR